MKKIAIFVSGSGSDMQSVIDATTSGAINGKVELIVANKSEIYALERARKSGIDSVVFRLKDYTDHVDRDRAILLKLDEYGIDLIVLAGYLSIVTDVLVKPYEGRIINIHPSLIPKHCGKGYYGIKVHESVLASGDTETGATVHYVDEGADTGAIIEQVVVPVLEGDTPETLQRRVLEQEHKLLPKVVARLCEEN